VIWECCECGERIARDRPPIVCRECGTAGSIFVRADETELACERDSFRASWLRAGMERNHMPGA
jgi:hypothetical protein